jgi:hypothetical protein
MPSIDRRTFLAALSAGAVAGVAGCSSSCPDTDPPEPTTVIARSDAADPGFEMLPGGTWPGPRGDAANTGYAPGGVPPAPTVRWRTRIDGRPAAPVVADGTAYLATDAGVVALSLRDGSERWVNADIAPATAGDTERPAPPRIGDAVYVATADGVAALGVGDGAVEWRRPVAAVDTPALAGATVVVPTAAGLIALDATDGRERWTASLGGAAGHPAVVDGMVVAAGGELGAFTTDGRERWRRDRRIGGVPAAAGGRCSSGRRQDSSGSTSGRAMNAGPSTAGTGGRSPRRSSLPTRCTRSSDRSRRRPRPSRSAVATARRRRGGVRTPARER